MSTPEKPKVLLIVNPHAGKMKSKIGMFDIISLLSSKGYLVTAHCTTGPKDATETVLTQTAGHDMVVCCGGDGTLNEVISGMVQLEKPVPIGYVPTGSTNDYARTLGIPAKIKKAAKIMSMGTPTPLDVGRLNEDIYFTYVASFGAFTKLSYKTPQRMKNKLGHLAYVLGGIQQISEIHPYRAKITTDRFSAEGDFIFGAITNTTSLGGVLNLNKRDVDLSDGKFEVLLIRQPQNTLELTDILNGLVRQQYDARHIFFFRTNHLELEFESDASWTVDGEFGGSHQRVVIENLHKAIEIIKV